MINVVSSTTFTDLDSLIEVLTEFKSVVSVLDPTAVVYVVTREAKAKGYTTLEEEILTDGSKVYNVYVSGT